MCETAKYKGKKIGIVAGFHKMFMSAALEIEFFNTSWGSQQSYNLLDVSKQDIQCQEKNISFWVLCNEEKMLHQWKGQVNCKGMLLFFDERLS